MILGVVAVVGVIVGAFPVARLSGAILTAYAASPVVEAAVSISDGFVTPVDRQRLEAAGDDPLALMALAIDARRSGSPDEADERYRLGRPRSLIDGTTTLMK